MSLTLRDKQSLYHSLAQLVRTGVPFPKAVDKLAQGTNGDQRRLLDAARQSLAAGHTVGEAFAKQAPSVTTLESAVISAVEKSGQLDRGLNDLSDYFGALNQARHAILKKSAYPIVQLHIGMVLPAILAYVFKGAGAFWHELAASFVLVYGIAVIVALLVPLLREAGASNASVDRFLNVIPLVGAIRRSFALSRFCMVYGLQLDAGINVINALLAAGRASRSGLVHSATDAVTPRVRSEGTSAGPLLAETGAFPSELTQGLIVGEETGSLDDELHRLAKLYRDKAFSALEVFADWLPRLLYGGISVFLIFKIVEIFEKFYLGAIQEVLK